MTAFLGGLILGIAGGIVGSFFAVKQGWFKP